MSEKPSESEQHELLDAWSTALLASLGIPDAPVDIDGVLGLAGAVAHAVVRPAAPLTAYLVGLAVGRSLGHGNEAEAFAAAVSTARALAESGDYAETP
jgi:Domain of unknown function (DUF6457)